MSYTHTFYAVDLDRLRGLYGSSDEAFADALFKAKEENISDNDAFFEHAIESGDCPSTQQAIRDILAGKVSDKEGVEAMYGYALGIICDHLGTIANNDDVYCVRDHPYASKLVKSGPPIAIPVDHGDFPEIGFIAKQDLTCEIKSLDAAPRRAKKSPLLSLLSLVTGGVIGKQMGDDEVASDMEAYREALVFCQTRDLSLVSLRH